MDVFGKEGRFRAFSLAFDWKIGGKHIYAYWLVTYRQAWKTGSLHLPSLDLYHGMIFCFSSERTSEYKVKIAERST